MTEFQQILKEWGACEEGVSWVGDKTLSEAWATCENIGWMMWLIDRADESSERATKLRLFACWCVRRVWHLLTDERSRHAIETAEKFARGEASEAQLCDAELTARKTHRDAAARAAVCVALPAPSAAAWNAAHGAVHAAGMGLDGDARKAAQTAASAAQVTKLREMWVF